MIDLVTHITLCLYLPLIAEEETHWQRYSDHHLPRARLQAVLPEMDTLTLPAHLCHRQSGEPQHQVHQIQVGTALTSDHTVLVCAHGCIVNNFMFDIFLFVEW